jgi:peptidoglycan hydrolase-like protein with peptidoglycan-binding domain
MLAGPALAQTTGGRTPQTQQAPSRPDKPGDAGSPATSPSTPAGESTKPDAMKSDTMKSSKAGRAGRTGNREQVMAAQEALKQKGFDPGPADGMMGPKTRAALKSEQLDQTGRLDAETMAKLGVQAKANGASPSASPPTSPTRQNP